MKPSTVAVFAGCLLSSCATKLDRINAIPATRVGDAIFEVKKQLSAYDAAIALYKAHPELDKDFIAASRKGFKCGKGLIQFEITSVALSLTTTNSSTLGASVGFSVPVLPGSADISASGSGTVDNTQQLDVAVYPAPLKPGFEYTVKASDRAPLRDELLAVRKGFLDAATQEGACYYDYNYKDKKGDKGNTYKWGLAFTATGSAGVTLKLAPLTAGVSGEAKSVTGNTLTATFAQESLPGGGLGIGVTASDHGLGAPRQKKPPRPPKP